MASAARFSVALIARHPNPAGRSLLISPIALQPRPHHVEPSQDRCHCGREPVPLIRVNEQAVVKSWSKSDGRNWKPPACTGWAEVGFTTLVTIAARFPILGTRRLAYHIGDFTTRRHALLVDYSQSGEH
jgi:hypothetical protein